MLYECTWLCLLLLLLGAARGLSDGELASLHALYRAADGGAWDWRDSVPAGPVWAFDLRNQSDPCATVTDASLGPRAWQGVVCTRDPQECLTLPPLNCSVAALELASYSLEGTLPAALGNLPRLQKLDVTSNLLHGDIPSELGRLSELRSLFLRVNCLDGSIPPEIGYLSNLVTLNIRNNMLGGSIPSTIGQLGSLEHFYIYVNNLFGPIPPELGNMAALRYFSIDDNFLEGSIPSTLGKLTNLVYFDVDANFLDGSIPTELGALAGVETMVFRNNLLGGTLPSAIVSCTSLEYLNFCNNYFEGSIPSALASLSSLEYLYIYRNHLHGSIPSALGDMLSLKELKLNQNHLSGTVPPQLALASSLQFLFLYYNRLTGRLPAELARLPDLEILRVQHNRLSGDLSDFVSALPTGSPLEILDISDNIFSGTLPGPLFALPQLKTVAASNCCLNGGLPRNLCESSTLEVLILDGLSGDSHCPNREAAFGSLFSAMTGSIPPCLFSMSALSVLHLAGNGFSGSVGHIPADSVLTNVSLSRNHLTGTIPDDVLRHPFALFDVSYNRIAGTLSTYDSQSDLVNTTAMVAQVNRLSGTLPGEIDSKNIYDLSILNGNLFSCSSDAGRGHKDEEHDNTFCGSEDLDTALYCTAAVVVAIGVSLVFIRASRKATTWTSRAHSRALVALQIRQHLSRSPDMYPDLYRFFNIIERMCAAIVVGGVGLFVVTATVYAALKLSSSTGNYSTHIYQYRYKLSAAMLSGIVPSVLVVLLWTLSVCGLYYWLIAVDSSLSTDTSRTLSTTKRGCQQWGAVGFVLTANAAVVLALNGAYVYLIVSDISATQKGFLQLSVGAFRVLWNKMMSTTMSRILLGVGSDINQALLSCLYICNNLFFPCAAFLFTDSSCFYDFFVEPNIVTSTYQYEECVLHEVLLDGSSKCGLYETAIDSSSYVPFFVYNFQCGSSMLRAFIPVVLFSLAVSTMTSAIVTLFPLVYPEVTLFKPARLLHAFSSSSGTLEESRMLLNVPLQNAQMVERLAILLSFGLACPYVAMACAISAFSLWVQLMMFVAVCQSKTDLPGDTAKGREEASFVLTLLHLESTCKESRHSSLRVVLRMVAAFSGVFIGLLCVDIAADDNRLSWDQALIFFVFPMVICTGLLGYDCACWTTSSSASKSRANSMFTFTDSMTINSINFASAESSTSGDISMQPFYE